MGTETRQTSRQEEETNTFTHRVSVILIGGGSRCSSREKSTRPSIRRSLFETLSKRTTLVSFPGRSFRTSFKKHR